MRSKEVKFVWILLLDLVTVVRIGEDPYCGEFFFLRKSMRILSVHNEQSILARLSVWRSSTVLKIRWRARLLKLSRLAGRDQWNNKWVICTPSITCNPLCLVLSGLDFVELLHVHVVQLPFSFHWFQTKYKFQAKKVWSICMETCTRIYTMTVSHEIESYIINLHVFVIFISFNVKLIIAKWHAACRQESPTAHQK